MSEKLLTPLLVVVILGLGMFLYYRRDKVAETLFYRAWDRCAEAHGVLVQGVIGEFVCIDITAVKFADMRVVVR